MSNIYITYDILFQKTIMPTDALVYSEYYVFKNLNDLTEYMLNFFVCQLHF